MPSPWKVIGSRITYRDRWLTVRSDRCVRWDGSILDPYHVIEYSTWVSMIALTQKNHVVLTREYRHGSGCIETGLPGGGVEPSDASPAAAAARELLEETGYSCETWHEVGRCYANSASQNNEIVFYLGLGAIKTSPQAFDDGEDIDVVLMPWKRYVERATKCITQAFHVAAILYVERFMGNLARD